MLIYFLYLIDVLICCQYGVSDLQTDLGSNVTINCDLDENEVYWILLKTADPPTVILRSFPTPKSPFYPNKTFRKKYSVQFKHRLVINNVTADELGVYYCMNTETPPKLSNSTRIYITGEFIYSFSNQSKLISTVGTFITESTKCHNHTMEEFIDQTQWQIISIVSALMNGLLIIVLIGLLKVFVFGSRRSLKCSRQPNADLQQMQVIEQQHPDQLQYAEVDFTKLRKNMRPSQVNSTYAALNLPKNTSKTQQQHQNILQRSTITECHNHTVVIDQNQTQWQIIIIISALMNGLLIIVVIGLLRVFVFESIKHSRQPADLQQTQVTEQKDSDQLQYTEVDFAKLRKKINTNQQEVNSTYAALKPPKFWMSLLKF
ncbi:Ig kappa chain V19-17 [Labeo rohita]|uniref:Ig kappa chain V19-17 n=1 Tax=Labeo rohita TaxID=84645 RepID=A0ABQ8L350_LABRO|nr:Ig kappa chain V19-17 [Labeo rohita]